MKLPQCFSFRAEKKKKQSNETKRDLSGEQRKNVNQNFLRKNFFDRLLFEQNKDLLRI